MSLRKIQVQYVGSALSLPKLERDVTLIVTSDGKRFVPERDAVTGKWVPSRGWVCGNCNNGLHGYPRFCPNCGGRINYEKREDAPKAVLD